MSRRFWRWYWTNTLKSDAQPLLRRAYALGRLMEMGAVTRITLDERVLGAVRWYESLDG